MPRWPCWGQAGPINSARSHGGRVGVGVVELALDVVPHREVPGAEHREHGTHDQDRARGPEQASGCLASPVPEHQAGGEEREGEQERDLGQEHRHGVSPLSWDRSPLESEYVWAGPE